MVEEKDTCDNKAIVKTLHVGENNEVFFFHKHKNKKDTVFAEIEVNQDKVKRNPMKLDLRRQIVLSDSISDLLLWSSTSLVRLIEQGNLLVVNSPFSLKKKGAQEKHDKDTSEQAVYFCNLETNKVEWGANRMHYFIAKRQGKEKDPVTKK